MTTSLLMSKIVNLSDLRRARARNGGDKTESKGPEQRREYRRISRDRLFLQVIDSDNRDLIGTTISGHALDVSANGLRMQSDVQVPVGSKLDLWVDISSRPGKFFLTSEVRWNSEETLGEFHLGVQLIEGPATDIEEWRNLHG